MAPRPRKHGPRRKSKIVILNTSSTTHGQNIKNMFEGKTKTNATIASVIDSAGSNDTGISAAQTIQEPTTTSNPVVVGEKRKRGDTVDNELDEVASPRKKRTMSHFSSPAGRTRSQLKALEQILDKDQRQSLDFSARVNDQPPVKAGEQPEDDSQVAVVKIEKQDDYEALAIDNNVPADDNEIPADHPVVAAAKVKKGTSKIAISAKVKKRTSKIAVVATKVEEEAEFTVKAEDPEVQLKSQPARKSKDVANGRMAKQQSSMALQQSGIAKFVKKQEPHPESKSGYFKIVKLKYMQSGNFRLPVDLVKDLKFDEFPERHVKTGVFRLRSDAPFWDHGDLGIKFGFSPFITRVEPTPAQCLSVWNTLDSWLRNRDPPIVIEAVGTIGAQGPAHGNAGITVDCLVRTIMAQATANELALTVQSLVNQRFTYTVNGEQVEGKLPNYHTMRVTTQEALEDAIKQGGLFRGKARTIRNALDAVYNKNIELTKAANGGQLPPGIELGQEPEQPDFVPGMLSMDFLQNMGMADIFNFIEGIEGIGHKTAACILEFNYGFPICAVDVHVNKMARYLGWVPENSPELLTFKHLEGRIPDNLKHLIHQAFWHHSQLCKRCKLGLARDDAGLDKNGDAAEACPLEHLMTRFKPKVVARKAAVVGIEQGPKKFKVWTAFASVEEAAAEGYAPLNIAKNDDFNSGSINISMKKKWVHVRGQKE